MSTSKEMSLVDYVLQHKVTRSDLSMRYYRDLMGVVKIASFAYHFIDGETRRRLVDKVIEIGRVIPDYEEFVDEFEEFFDDVEEVRIKPPYWKSVS